MTGKEIKKDVGRKGDKNRNKDKKGIEANVSVKRRASKLNDQKKREQFTTERKQKEELIDKTKEKKKTIDAKKARENHKIEKKK